MKSVLVLEDGTYFAGEAFGKEGEVFGEVVFNTSMTGYQEVLTDPSYNGQIVAMTYPLIGNYGFNGEDSNAKKPYLQGFIVKELCDAASNWRKVGEPEDFFIKHNITGIKGIDTRALTQHLRQFGSMYGMISTVTGNIDVLLENLVKSKQRKRDLVMEVTTESCVHEPGSGKRVVVLDFGVRNDITASLKKRNLDIYVMPADSTVSEIMSYNPDGILLTNGPGDPRDIPYAINTVKQLVGKKPILGICMGHQLLGLALGQNIYKLKFGHHGSNHPVRDFNTSKCYITSQNHNYALSKGTDHDIVITHLNINDNTIEGFRHRHLPIVGIQYHPEEEQETGDCAYIFDDFVRMMDKTSV